MKKHISFVLLSAILLLSSSFYSQKKGFSENIQKKNVAKVLDDLNADQTH
jgi:hypothetical protein